MKFKNYFFSPFSLPFRGRGANSGVFFSLTRRARYSSIPINERRLNITKEFFFASLFCNTNKKQTINKRFSLSFLLFIQLKDRLLNDSSLLFSIIQYAQKERYYKTVFPCFPFYNTNKSRALTGRCFEATHLPETESLKKPIGTTFMLMRRSNSHQKVPCEFSRYYSVSVTDEIVADSFSFFSFHYFLKDDKKRVILYFTNFRVKLSIIKFVAQDLYNNYYSYYERCVNLWYIKRRTLYAEEDEGFIPLIAGSKDYYLRYLLALSLYYNDMSNKVQIGKCRVLNILNNNGFVSAEPEKLALALPKYNVAEIGNTACPRPHLN